MGVEAKKALARVGKAVPIDARAEVLKSALPGVQQGIEAAFLAFLHSKAGAKAMVPVDRRVFLTVAESAEFTGLPLAFLRRLMVDGRLKAFKTGSGWRIPRTELEGLSEKLMEIPAPLEEMTLAEERDLATNKLRRQGLLPPLSETET